MLIIDFWFNNIVCVQFRVDIVYIEDRNLKKRMNDKHNSLPLIYLMGNDCGSMECERLNEF